MLDSDGFETVEGGEADLRTTCSQSPPQGETAAEPEVETLDRQQQTLPLPPRQRSVKKEDRGLADDPDLEHLATSYLEEQAKHFPHLVGTTLLPRVSAEVVKEMVENFKAFHRGAEPDFEAIKQQCAQHDVKPAAGYKRYSTDESQPTSIVDQQRKILEKAATTKSDNKFYFVHWHLVRADYGVSGRYAGRAGYQSMKRIVKSGVVDIVLIDDWSRLSREAIESWKLAANCEGANVRLLGASDGFDSTAADSKLKISLYIIISTLLISSIQQKVRRGLEGAFLRGMPTGRTPYGFGRQKVVDDHGAVKLNAKGKPETRLCVHPITSQIRLEIYRLFVENGWSEARISRHFNEVKKDGFNGWTPTTIYKLIEDESCVGIFWHNKRTSYFDTALDKMRSRPNPKSDWIRSHRPRLAFVPQELFDAAQRKKAERKAQKLANPKKRREPDVKPKSWLLLVLSCGYCESRISQVQSADVPRCGCVNGVLRKYDCKLSASKSVQLVEQAILRWVAEHLALDSVIDAYVDAANNEIEAEAAKTSVDESAQRRKLETAMKHRDRAVEELLAADDPKMKDVLRSKLRSAMSDIERLEAQLEAQIARRSVESSKLSKDDAKRLVENLRNVVSQDPERCGDVVREITGPVRVFQEEVPNRPGHYRWILRFKPQWRRQIENLLPSEMSAYAKMIASRLPESAEEEIIVDQTPLYEQRAEECARLRDQGVPIATIAKRLGTSDSGVIDSLNFHRKGIRRKYSKKGNKSGRRQTVKYKQIAPEVCRRHDDEGESMEQIADALGVGVETVHRAYDYARPEFAQDAVKAGTKVKRPRVPRVGIASYRKIDELANSGMTYGQIADQAGCSSETVRRRLKKLGHPDRKPRRHKK